ncbi:hypothetical protein HWV62_21838 [Athelia sp. TMB]|nr:hypothetical protein HWV62_21838 [Athelia sp. TMB]
MTVTTHIAVKEAHQLSRSTSPVDSSSAASVLLSGPDPSIRDDFSTLEWTPYSLDLEQRALVLSRHPLHDGSTSVAEWTLIGSAVTSLLMSMLCGIVLIAAGMAPIQQYIIGDGGNVVYSGLGPSELPSDAFSTSSSSEKYALGLNIIVTLFTEAIGFVHSITLRSALSTESRLKFNTNLRLFTASKSAAWSNPNGILANIAMSILLVISYSSATLTILPFALTLDGSTSYDQPYILRLPCILLGSSLFLQSLIALVALCKCLSLIQSSSALGTASTLIDGQGLFAERQRCMHNLLDDNPRFSPREPLASQPSAWNSHKAVKKIIILAWCLVVAYVAWGGIVALLAVHANSANIAHWNTSNVGYWSLVPKSGQSAALQVEFHTDDPSGSFGWATWLALYLIFTVLQGGLTLQLHCCEVVTNVVRDEASWRAASVNGASLSVNPITAVLGSWHSLLLLAAKPFMHWMFGLSLSVRGQSTLASQTMGDQIYDATAISSSLTLTNSCFQVNTSSPVANPNHEILIDLPITTQRFGT